MARCYAVIADAPGDTGVLLLGGWDRPLESDSSWQPIWAFRPGTGWSEVATDSMPEPGDVFGYDAGSDRAVFVEVGGSTWTFDPSTGTWEDRTPEVSPPAHGARMVYDSESNRLITFGGDNFTGPLFDNTWAYDYETNTWTKMHPANSPSARSYYAMAYDERSDRVILFGGHGGAGDLGDTWAYDYNNDTWTRLLNGGGPHPRTYSAMTYDRKTDRLILFGGAAGPEEEPLGDTWAYNLKTNVWKKLRTAGPSARGWHVMAADRETNSIVLFGGGSSRGDCTAETWIFDPADNRWTLVP